MDIWGEKQGVMPRASFLSLYIRAKAFVNRELLGDGFDTVHDGRVVPPSQQAANVFKRETELCLQRYMII